MLLSSGGRREKKRNKVIASTLVLRACTNEAKILVSFVTPNQLCHGLFFFLFVQLLVKCHIGHFVYPPQAREMSGAEKIKIGFGY